MIPVIALVGRPNVGKSTLFNRLTRSRDALVADIPGLTRDRQYGEFRAGERRFIVIDTGGRRGGEDGIECLIRSFGRLGAPDYSRRHDLWKSGVDLTPVARLRVRVRR